MRARSRSSRRARRTVRLIRRDAAFTRTELVVLLAISAAILAVVVPNMCGGRHRPAVARVKSDHRSLAAAIECYFTDHRTYPAERPMRDFVTNTTDLGRRGGAGLSTLEPGRPGLHGLTTPVAYIGTMFRDSLPEGGWWNQTPARPFAYHRSANADGWLLWSVGPDGDYDIRDGAAVYNPEEHVPSDALEDLTYDPTNGTESGGDVYRVKRVGGLLRSRDEALESGAPWRGPGAQRGLGAERRPPGVAFAFAR